MKKDKWNKLNKELDDALEEEFGSEEPNYNMKQEIIAEIKKQETLEEAAEKYAKQFDYAEDSSPLIDFIEGAKYQAEKMYSEEQLRSCFNDAKSKNYESFGEWFEQFKKK
jgi:hypothetical protein